MSMLDRNAVRHSEYMERSARRVVGNTPGYLREVKRNMRSKSREAAKRVIRAELIHLENEIPAEELLYLKGYGYNPFWEDPENLHREEAPDWWDEDGKPDEMDRYLDSMDDDPYKDWFDYDDGEPDGETGGQQAYDEAIKESLMECLDDLHPYC